MPKDPDQAGGGQEAARDDPLGEGRSDPRHLLLDRLPTAPPRYAQGALMNPAMDEGVAQAMLRNAGLTEAILRDVADRFRRSDAVKLALVKHPKTPTSVSMQLLKFAHWRDLMEVMDDARLPNPLRALAEKTVGERVAQMPSMEQTRLARSAGRGLVEALLRTRKPRVIQELLLNPRLVERDVLKLARDPNVASEVLASLTRQGSWGRRPVVRNALIENPQTPLGEALKLLAMLTLQELRAVTRNVRLRAPIRNEAQKRIKQAERKA